MSSQQIDLARDFIADKDNDPSRLQEVMKLSGRTYVEMLFELLECEDKRVRNRTAKLIAQFSEQKPNLIEPQWDRLVQCVSGSENILRWNALMAFGQMASLDSGERIQSLLPTLMKLLEDESMVTAGHAISALGKIAKAHKETRRRILQHMLTVHEVSRNAECNQILIGKVLAALEPWISNASPKEKATILDYAKAQEQSLRSSTQKLAKRLSKKMHQQRN